MKNLNLAHEHTHKHTTVTKSLSVRSRNFTKCMNWSIFLLWCLQQNLGITRCCSDSYCELSSQHFRRLYSVSGVLCTRSDESCIAPQKLKQKEKQKQFPWCYVRNVSWLGQEIFVKKWNVIAMVVHAHAGTCLERSNKGARRKLELTWETK